jgi:hypothetical protein
MPIVVLTSAAGAPGTTTTALGLALTWPGPTVLVEADPAGSAIVPGWYRSSVDAAERNLVRIATTDAYTDITRAVLDQCVRLTPDDDTERLLLMGYSEPALAPVMRDWWEPLGDAFRALSDQGYTVIVDSGRITQGSYPDRLLYRADQVLMVCRTAMASVVRSEGMTGQLRQLLAGVGAADRLGVVVIGGHGWMRVDAGQVAREFGAKISIAIPEDQEGAAVLSDGIPQQRRRRWRRHTASVEHGVSSQDGVSNQDGPHDPASDDASDDLAPTTSTLLRSFRDAARILDQHLNRAALRQAPPPLEPEST